MRIAKQISKKFGVALAALMVLSVFLSAGVFGANATITVNAPSGVNLNGATVTAYNVLEADTDDAGNIINYQLAQNSGFANFFGNVKTEYNSLRDDTTLFLSYSDTTHSLSLSGDSGETAIDNTTKLDTTYFEADLLSRIADNSSAAALLSDWLSDYIATNVVSLTSSANATFSDAASVTLNVNDAPGYYALIYNNLPSGVAEQNSILQVVEGNISVTMKVDSFAVDKTVKDDVEQDYADAESAAVGDVLDYQISTSIPDASYNMLEAFSISDTLVNQALDADSFVLSMNNTQLTYNPANHEFTSADDTVIATLTTTDYTTQAPFKSTFKLDFNVNNLTNYRGQSVVLTYKAEVMAEAATDNGNNTVTVTIDNGDNVTEITDTTQLYTYGLDVQKTFSDGSNTYSGVTFQLRTDANDENTAINFTGSNGAYVKADTEDSNQIKNLNLNTTNGKLDIKGLDVGTYYLVETAAPSGFKTVTVEVTLVDNNLDGDLDQTGNNAEITAGGNAEITVTPNDDTASFTVLNQKGFSIPNTGAAGTTLLTIGGIVLIVAAAGGLMIARKKSAK